MALNYDKWDHIDDSDDESSKNSKVEPLLESTKQNAQRASDAAVAERFTVYLRQHLKKEHPLAKRKLAAQFVGAQHRGEASSNIYRYNDICAFLSRYGDELTDRSIISMLCELHKRMIDGVPSADIKNDDHPVVMDCQVLMDAINALEACATHGNAVIFYETVCTPSASERARSLTERYERKEFAKRAMLKHIFKDDSAFNPNDLDDDDPAPPGSSARKTKKRAPVWWQDPDMRLLVGVLVGSIVVLGGLGASFYAIR